MKIAFTVATPNVNSNSGVLMKPIDQYQNNGYAILRNVFSNKEIAISPGDILIFSAQMIHRGNYKLNPVRKAFGLCVGRYHPLASDFLNERVLPTEEEMASISNNNWYKLA